MELAVRPEVHDLLQEHMKIIKDLLEDMLRQFPSPDIQQNVRFYFQNNDYLTSADSTFSKGHHSEAT